MRIANILAPTDFSESSRRALALAVDLAKKFDANVTLLHVFEVPAYAYAGLGTSTVDYVTPIEDGTRECLATELRELSAMWPHSAALFRKGPPWRETLLAAEETGADLIVMGTHGRQGLSHALLGSLAEKMVRLSTVPVLTVREPRK